GAARTAVHPHLPRLAAARLGVRARGVADARGPRRPHGDRRLDAVGRGRRPRRAAADPDRARAEPALHGHALRLRLHRRGGRRPRLPRRGAAGRVDGGRGDEPRDRIPRLDGGPHRRARAAGGGAARETGRHLLDEGGPNRMKRLLPGLTGTPRVLVLAGILTVLALGGTFLLDPYRNFQLATAAAYFCAIGGLTVLIGLSGQLS